jgi:hypothetical protein
MRSQVALALALALVALRQCPTHAAKTLANPFQPDNDLPCACSDIDPRSFFTTARGVAWAGGKVPTEGG